jgi:hypothetical protein
VRCRASGSVRVADRGDVLWSAAPAWLRLIPPLRFFFLPSTPSPLSWHWRMQGEATNGGGVARRARAPELGVLIGRARPWRPVDSDGPHGGHVVAIGEGWARVARLGGVVGQVWHP